MPAAGLAFVPRRPTQPLKLAQLFVVPALVVIMVRKNYISALNQYIQLLAYFTTAQLLKEATYINISGLRACTQYVIYFIVGSTVTLPTLLLARPGSVAVEVILSLSPPAILISATLQVVNNQDYVQNGLELSTTIQFAIMALSLACQMNSHHINGRLAQNNTVFVREGGPARGEASQLLAFTAGVFFQQVFVTAVAIPLLCRFFRRQRAANVLAIVALQAAALYKLQSWALPSGGEQAGALRRRLARLIEGTFVRNRDNAALLARLLCEYLACTAAGFLLLTLYNRWTVAGRGAARRPARIGYFVNRKFFHFYLLLIGHISRRREEIGLIVLNMCSIPVFMLLTAMECLRRSAPGGSYLLNAFYDYSRQFSGDNQFILNHIQLFITTVFYFDLEVFLATDKYRTVAAAGVSTVLVGDAVACLLPQLLSSGLVIPWTRIFDNEDLFRQRTVVGTIANYISELCVLLGRPRNELSRWQASVLALAGSVFETVGVSDNLLCGVVYCIVLFLVI